MCLAMGHVAVSSDAAVMCGASTCMHIVAPLPFLTPARPLDQPRVVCHLPPATCCPFWTRREHCTACQRGCASSSAARPSRTRSRRCKRSLSSSTSATSAASRSEQWHGAGDCALQHQPGLASDMDSSMQAARKIIEALAKPIWAERHSGVHVLGHADLHSLRPVTANLPTM